MRDYIRLAGTLFIICLVAAVLLVTTNNITEPIITKNAGIAAEKAKKVVLPTGDSFVDYKEEQMAEIKADPNFSNIKSVSEAKAGSETVGYAISIAADGYGGKFEAMVGVGVDGKISGISMGTNSETPGFGKKAELPDFYEQYIGKSWDSPITYVKEGATGNQINQITGASVTSKGVTAGVNQAVALAKQLAESNK